MRARDFAAVLFAVLFFVSLSSGCGDPELSDEAKETQGSSDPTAETGSPLPGIPPDLPSGVPPG